MKDAICCDVAELDVSYFKVQWFLFIGNYKSYFNESDFTDLLTHQRSEYSDHYSHILRSRVVPNAFGMIKYGYENLFSLIPLVDNLRIYGDVLFSDWRES